MGVAKVYTCDLCGEPRERAMLTRLGVRGLDDRPEDADIIDVGPCCRERPLRLVLEAAEAAHQQVTGG